MNENALDLEGVAKSYQDFCLAGLDLSLPEGSILGLIGPNGAGKSTIIRILMGLVRADAGSIRVLGRALPQGQVEVKRDIGYVSEDMRLYEQGSIRWHMDLVRSVFPRWDEPYARHLLERFELGPAQRVGGLSHGQRVKAALLLALARRPRLLILDEPTTGLDPVVRHQVLAELMEAIADQDRSILFSSHNTQDVEQISDLIAFIDRGKLIELQDKETFLDSWRRLRLVVPRDRSLPEIPGLSYDRRPGSVRVATTNRFSEHMVRALEAQGISVSSIEPMNLEEIFLANVLLSRGLAA
jgi:ABC-2 type transport system ATP-binding protein